MARTGAASGCARIVAAYEPSVRDRMRLSAESADDGAALRQSLAEMPAALRDLAEALLASVGAGEALPDRLRTVVEQNEELWLGAVIVPRVSPSAGATIDPRFYAGLARTNPALAGAPLFEDLREPGEVAMVHPRLDARWDAIVVAAASEGSTLRLTQGGVPHREDLRRLVARLGPDEDRWRRAFTLALATGLVRAASGNLHGFPEARARSIADPSSLLPGPGPVAAGALLVRVADARWLQVDRLWQRLLEVCPDCFASGGAASWEERELVWLQEACTELHLLGIIDLGRGPDGTTCVRRSMGPSARPPGFLLTPDRDVLVAPWELSAADYGRLCRVAPYVDGDVVHRHHLTRDGVSADISHGYVDAVDWLASLSRTGLPSNVRESVIHWQRSADRITLLSGVAVLERPDGTFVFGEEPADREFDYDSDPSGELRVERGVVTVAFGADPLTVRAAVARIGDVLPPSATGWRWRIRPGRVRDADRLLERLRSCHRGQLPGELEAAVVAAGGARHFKVEPSVVVHLDREALFALQRDRLVGDLLWRGIGNGQAVVGEVDLPRIRARLAELGFEEGGEE